MNKENKEWLESKNRGIIACECLECDKVWIAPWDSQIKFCPHCGKRYLKRLGSPTGKPLTAERFLEIKQLVLALPRRIECLEVQELSEDGTFYFEMTDSMARPVGNVTIEANLGLFQIKAAEFFRQAPMIVQELLAEYEEGRAKVAQ